MGNRAVIAFNSKTAPTDVAIYLHWNGGVESVKAFLDYAKEVGVRGGEDKSYCLSRLCQIMGNFFGGTTSLGIDQLRNLDCNNNDNGLYLINDELKIVGRCYIRDGEDLVPVSVEGRKKYDDILAQLREINDPFFKGRD